MNLHGQINAACKSRPGHSQLCHWSVWIVLECGFHVKYKMDFSSCDIMLGFGKSSHIRYRLQLLASLSYFFRIPTPIFKFTIFIFPHFFGFFMSIDGQ